MSEPTPTLEELLAEIEAWRKAFHTGDGPNCEDVCLRECLGVCGA